MKPKTGAPHHDRLTALKRIEGQIRGIQKMIQERRYCVDIMIQLKAIKAAVYAVEKKIFLQHLRHCVQQAIESKKTKEVQRILKEIENLIQKNT